MVERVPYIDFGGSGPILHFAHANGFPPGTYRQMLSRLTAHCRVLAMCLRPLWPDSNPQEFDNWQLISDDIYNFLQQQGCEQIIGVGHSLGAVATMKAAVRFPALFRAIVLIEPVFMPPDILQVIAENPETARQTPLYRKTVKRRRLWPDRPAVFDHFRSKSVFQRWPDDALWDYVEHGFHETAEGQIALTYRREWEAQIYAHFPLSIWQEVPQISQPTLAIRGSESDTLFPPAWNLWQELQPQATFVEVPDAGHMIPVEKPGIVATRIIEFLN